LVIVATHLASGYPTHNRHVLHTAPLLIVEGVAQQKGGVTNLLAQRVVAMPQSSRS